MKSYVVGHPGTGKTTRLTDRLADLITSGVRPDRVLVLVPQSAQARRFRLALARAKGNTRGEPYIGTFYALAQQHVGLFFPRIADRAGFGEPGREPTFINVESAQYFLDQIVAPRSAEFDDLKLHRPRLLSQILDDLNKAATSGFPLDELAQRLASAWTGPEPRAGSYQRAQQLAHAYRTFCLQHSLLDFSLWVDVFGRHLLAADFYREFVAARYRHVLVDNVEEGTPIMHDFVALLLNTCDSAAIVEDDPGGYRLFLGADPRSARQLRERCDAVEHIPDARLAPGAPASPAQFGTALMQSVRSNARLPVQDPAVAAQVELLDDGGGGMRYWTNMVQAVVERIAALVAQGARPNEIAVLAPFVEDVLRFELSERLRPRGIGVFAIRPSRPLYDHPVTRALVTWAKLGHPAWRIAAPASELARALSVSIADLDLVRAQVIADAAQRVTTTALPAIEEQALWNRVGMRFRERYVALQAWLAGRAMPEGKPEPQGAAGAARAPLDLFWQQLFTDVLSQPGFGLNADLDGALVCDRLVRSARAFREAFEQAGLTPRSVPTVEVEVLGLQPPPERSTPLDVGLAYVGTLMQGILAAQHVPERLAAGDAPGAREDEIILAPTYAYLTADLRSRHQFWLDINSTGWHDRIYQPLTHPYVLARGWQPGQPWTDADELYANRDMLARVAGGLAFRCSERIFLAQSQLSVAGQEEDGPLARAVQRVLLAVPAA